MPQLMFGAGGDHAWREAPGREITTTADALNVKG